MHESEELKELHHKGFSMHLLLDTFVAEELRRRGGVLIGLLRVAHQPRVGGQPAIKLPEVNCCEQLVPCKI
jgi:hypothetical protein